MGNGNNGPGMTPRPDMTNPTPLIFGVPMIDPLSYRPKAYVLTVECDQALEGTGRGSVPLDKYPFIWTHTTWALKDEDIADQDGNFLCQPKNIERFYTSDFARPDTLFGNPFDGPLIPWPVPVFVEEATTIFMEVINNKVRGQGDDTFKIEFVFWGIEKWKEDE